MSGISINDGFSVGAKVPIDTRFFFNTIADMKSYPETLIPSTYFCACEGSLYIYNDTNTEDSLTGKWRLFDGSGTVSFKDYTTGVGYKAGEYVVYDNIAYKVLKDYTSYNISDDIKDGNIKQFIGNNASGLANIIEISDVLTNTKIGGDETIASSILASDINDLQLNQLVYDTNGIIATINSIDTSANTVKLKIIHSNPDTQKVIPEPSSDDKLYFRSREVGATDGKWVEFTTVDGKTIKLTINKKASSTEGNYVPKAQELVYDTDNNYIVIGDGSTSLSGLKAFYNTTVTKSDIITALGYTPEDVLQKGQANGYAPLDANGLVPVGNLPANVVSSYSKSEIDNKDAATLTSATTLINSEASTARANEEAIKKDLETHVNDTAIHVTQADKDNWNKKVDQTDLANYDTHIADTSIHVTQSDKDKWDGMNKCYFVDNVSNLPTTNNDIGNMGYVKTSAAGITPIACATYIWDGSAWQEIDQTQVSLMFKWDNIQNRPTSTVLQIDDSVTKTHEHTNKSILDKISQSASGNFMYDGNEIGIKVEFLDTDKDLPNVGDDDTLYVVYVDSRVRNFPSISVYRGGAFQILGRGTQDMPQQVGDMVILQNEYFSVKANTSFIITVTSNQFFSFMPVEILKKVPGATGKEKILVGTDDASSFKYDDTVVDINNGIKLTIDSIPLKLDSVSDRYLLYEDVDLSKYKNISSIG